MSEAPWKHVMTVLPEDVQPAARSERHVERATGRAETVENILQDAPRLGAGEEWAGAAALASAVEQFLVADEHDRRAAFRVLSKHLKDAKAAGELEAIAGALRLAVTPTLDYTTAQAIGQFLKSLPKLKTKTDAVKLAILGGFTTHQLRDLVELYPFAAGIPVEIYESDYGVFRQQILDPGSALYEFKPKIVFLATHWRNIGHFPALSDSPEKVSDLLEAEFRDWAVLWNTIQERLGSQVLQNNFDTPPWRSLGNHEMRHSAAQSRFITDLNRLLAERAPPFVTIHDV